MNLPARPLLAASLSVLALASTASAQTTFPNVVWTNLGGKDLFVDIVIPATGTPPYPVAVHVHGGGWSGGTHTELGALSNALLARGFAIASVDYRLTSEAGQYGAFPVTFPAQIHDVKGAVRWLRANAATYQFDVTRFAAYGESAGGHLVALLGTSTGVAHLEGDVGGKLGFSSAVSAVVDMWGPIDLLQMNADVTTPPGSTIDHDANTSPESRLLGWSQPGQGIGDIRNNLANPTAPYPALAALAHDVNPVNWVDALDPPTFLIHGTSDTLVPVSQSLRLSAALIAAGVPQDMRTNPGAGHGGSSFDLSNAAADFIVAHLNASAAPNAGVAFCNGDGTALACPCGNASFTGTNTGCENSFQVGGGLSANGVASVGGDTLVLRGDSMPNGPALYFGGSARQNAGLGSAFGDGLLCVSGSIVRLAAHTNTSGFSRYPQGAEPLLSTLGGVVAGATRHYQVWYRDSPVWCSAATWNLTNGLSVTWAP
jgi:acetyl esterase/lipase